MRLALIAMIPVLWAYLALGVYIYLLPFQERVEHEKVIGETLARELAAKLQVCFTRSGDADINHPLIHAETSRILAMSEVARIELEDANGRILLNISSKNSATAIPYTAPIYDLSILSQGATSFSLPFADFYETLPRLGRVRLYMAWARDFPNWTLLGLILSLAFGSGFLLSWVLLQRLRWAFQYMEKRLEHLTLGNLSPQSNINAFSDLEGLTQRIQQLTLALKTRENRYQTRMASIESDYFQTLEALEESNVKLQLARNQAQLASKAKSDFLASMSHEIRTPMNSIIGFTELLGRSQLSPDQHEQLNNVRTAGEYLLQLVNEVLDLAKLESGTLEIHTAPFDPRQLVERILTAQAPQCRKKAIELTAHIYDDVPDQLIGDALRIGQILTNLLSNAVKFTSEGDIQVRLMQEESASPESMSYCFTVTDSGIGIPEEKQPLIFEAFAQGDEGISRAFGGTGLGLSICRRLAHAMGGDVGLHSSTNSGSVFYFRLELGEAPTAETTLRNAFAGLNAALLPYPKTLQHSYRALVGRLGYMGIHCQPIETFDGEISPDFLVGLEHVVSDNRSLSDRPLLLLFQGDNPIFEQATGRNIVAITAPISLESLNRAVQQMLIEEPQIPPEKQPDHENEGQLTGVRILVTDDNELNRKLSDQILRGQGAEVLTASSGEEAVTLMRSQDVQLILMDLHMPGCDGLEASRRIRAQEAESGKPRTPIIALTADAMSNLAGEIGPVGIDALVVKPFRMDALVGFIQQYRSAPESLPGPIVSPIMNATPDKYQRAIFVEFLQQIDSEIGEIKDGVDSKDCAALWEALHRFRGSIAVASATSLEEIVVEMSQAAKAEDITILPGLLAQLETQVDRLKQETSTSIPE